LSLLRHTNGIVGDRGRNMENKSTPKVCVEKQENIVLIRIQNPPANTLTLEVCEGLCKAFQNLPEETQVVVLTGNEQFFCAGAHIKAFSLEHPEENEAYFGKIYETLQIVENCPVPVIAAVNGVSMGAGMELALCCDLRVVDEKLRMGATSVNMGLVFCTQRLPRLIGNSKAMELLLTARVFQGEEAKAWGIAHKVALEGKALPVALAWAEEMCEKPNSCLKRIKKSVQEGKELPLKQALEQEQKQLFTAFRHPDFTNQVKKFLQRRREK